ncbi:hypothetical protein P153DRAFT_185158 [Dothidotthia symphoricarpi CBS 119687]|uniref:Uncharacterized protein n=1 Tax=Dothidotthia symphoricarpi CBS 119687 TaxID=1392245 RepID=A0A6A6AK10_9PLEO|nr:uncharacterized protein P153DRAFT_185158 [Dothidotthia symphoricarpi CBS 119687]KAF2132150.1 hypothetical protein P153DRAFT_185158 [Dothidotthia symphoricarpi CBS 119687]
MLKFGITTASPSRQFIASLLTLALSMIPWVYGPGRASYPVVESTTGRKRPLASMRDSDVRSARCNKPRNIHKIRKRTRLCRGRRGFRNFPDVCKIALLC